MKKKSFIFINNNEKNKDFKKLIHEDDLEYDNLSQLVRGGIEFLDFAERDDCYYSLIVNDENKFMDQEKPTGYVFMERIIDENNTIVPKVIDFFHGNSLIVATDKETGEIISLNEHMINEIKEHFFTFYPNDDSYCLIKYSI